jgi:hypothetical protein
VFGKVDVGLVLDGHPQILELFGEGKGDDRRHRDDMRDPLSDQPSSIARRRHRAHIQAWTHHRPSVVSLQLGPKPENFLEREHLLQLSIRTTTACAVIGQR